MLHRALLLLPLLAACAHPTPSPASAPTPASAPPTMTATPGATTPPPAPPEPPQADGHLGGGFVLEQGALHFRSIQCGPDDRPVGDSLERLAEVTGRVEVARIEGTHDWEARTADQVFTSQQGHCGFHLTRE